MSGRIRRGYTSGDLKTHARLDKGWTDGHGSDKVAGIRRKLKMKFLARKNSGVVGRGGNGAVEVDEKASSQKFVKEGIVGPDNKLLVQG